MDEILRGLNAAQRAAVSSPASVLQVLAPPGSGKTRTLTARVAYLIRRRGLTPRNIVVCTFTIKAAKEMKARMERLLGADAHRSLILGTFHSIARRFLLRYGRLIDLPRDFGVADASDTSALLGRIIKRFDLTTDVRTAKARISGMKARGQTIEQICPKPTLKPGTPEQQELQRIYAEYEDQLTASNLLDYDDLLLRFAELLQRHPRCASHIEAVLIDEFQDTNTIQYSLMRLLAQHSKTITIVGDPDQSIYKFRSADVGNLEQMRTDFPDTSVAHLEENYRSSAAILISSMQVIEQDKSRPQKRLLPTHCAGVTPVLRRLAKAAHEANWIVREIERVRQLTGNMIKRADCVILLRSAFLSRHIEAALVKSGIPYVMLAGFRFYDRVEVKLVLDYLRIICRPQQNDTLSRIINTPCRGIGEVTVRTLLEEAEVDKSSLWDLCLAVAQHRHARIKISAAATRGLTEFVDTIVAMQEQVSQSPREEFSLKELMEQVIELVGIKAHIEKSYPKEHEGRMANIQELLAQAADSGEESAQQGSDLPGVSGLDEPPPYRSEDILAAYLVSISLSTEMERKDGQGVGAEADADRVTVCTIHAAKGLEWPVVFIPSVYDGSIPHSRADDHDEERRLLYVGMTRAQSLLYLSCPERDSRHFYTTLSPFLSHANIRNYFADRGPSLDQTTVADIARILGRQCPSAGRLVAASKSLVHREDDYAPKLGRDAGSDAGSDDGTSEHRPSLCRTWSGTSYSASRVRSLHNPTMTSKDSFTINIAAQQSFVSARSYMSQQTTAAKVEQKEIQTASSVAASRQRGPKRTTPALHPMWQSAATQIPKLATVLPVKTEMVELASSSPVAPVEKRDPIPFLIRNRSAAPVPTEDGSPVRKRPVTKQFKIPTLIKTVKDVPAPLLDISNLSASPRAIASKRRKLT